MRPQSVCILGGTGFLGTRLCARLLRSGHRVTVLSRDRESHAHLRVLPELVVENCNVHDPAELTAHLRGHDVLINLVGILNERGFGGAGFRRAHTELTRGALQAAISAGVGHFMQVSALGADEDAPSHYLRSKGAAERLIREHGTRIGWTIYQPSVIFGPGDAFLNRFAALLEKIPLVFPLAMPGARLQPVHVDDVATALALGVAANAPARRTFQLGGPRVYTLREILAFVAECTGHRRLILGLPRAASRLQALLMDFVPGRPFSSDNFRSLCVDSVCREDGLALLGIEPQSMEGAACLYLGPAEDNARLSRLRRLAGRRAG